MLSDIERQRIDELLLHLPTKRAACIEAMKIVQEESGWISDQVLDDLAKYLEMTSAELDSVATFYNLIHRKPVGKHVIRICDSVSCWLMGEELLMDYLCQKLGIEPGQTTHDGMFTLLPIVCLGHCEQAPAMMLDDTIIGNLTPGKIDKILMEAAGTS